MRDVLPMIAVGLIALVVGGAATWLMMSGQGSGPHSASTNTMSQQATNRASDDRGTSTTTDRDDLEFADLQKLLSDSKKRETALEADKTTLEADKSRLTEENDQLKTDLAARDKRVAELESLASSQNRMFVGFGKWSELKEVREADWNDLGDAYVQMIPMLKELALAMAKGEEMDPELQQKIQSQNMRLVAHYAKVIKKLPTHAAANGEFTHPINMVNILAGQLDEAGVPLSDDQKKQLSALGEDYDQRWNKLQAGYDDKSWMLQKLYDEVALKQWFYEGMFAITTTEQTAIAVPPEIAGMIGLDLYSPGLMLQMNIQPLKSTDLATLKTNLKKGLSEATTIPMTTLDTAEYVFDDWINAAQLLPLTSIESDLYRTIPLIQAAKLQLQAMHTLEDSFVVDDEVRKKMRFVQRIVYLQLLKQE